MGKQPIDKEKVIQNKKNSIKQINRLLENYINSSDTRLLKKANLISYWLKTFCDYVEFEEKFEPKKLISYSRGDIIRVNFGFRIGKELGGLHFAVVLDNDNKQSADVLTVVPLSSTDGKTVHERSVDLGVELYEKVNDRQKLLISEAQEKLKEMTKTYDTLVKAIELVSNDDLKSMGDIDDIEEYKNDLQGKLEEMDQEIESLNRNKREIARMKTGSMAVVNQITTVSKQRIFTPKKSQDFLFGISLSTKAMEKINDKVVELYCRK